MPSYTFDRTREQVRDMVLRKLGAYGIGMTPNAADTALVYEGMNLKLQELHALGVLWWQVAGAATDVALTAGTDTVSLAAVTDFLYPVSLALRVGNDDQPIDIISHEQYQAIQGKAERGEPARAFFAGSTVYLWPVPASNYTAKLTYQAVAADVENGARPDVEKSMLRAFSVLVAYDCVDDFEVPEQKIARLEREAQKADRLIRTLASQRVTATTAEAEYF